MLHFIEGRAGSGKTHWIRRLLMERARAGEKKLLLLVPEQYSFESERAMLRLMGERDVRLVEISSFTRLSDLVFRKTGGLAGRRLDDGGRSIFMSLALEQVQDALALYRRQSDTVELVELMLTALTEFKMCGITPDQLRDAAERLEESSLKRKTEETALVLDAYDALISRSYLDPLDDLNRLSNALSEHSFFEDYVVCLDSFAGFTMQELQVLTHILRQAKEVYVTLCVDGTDRSDAGKMGLFAPVHKTIRQLKHIAAEKHISIASPVVLTEAPRFSEEGLRLLEQNVYRKERISDLAVPEAVSLYNAADRYDEANFVARTIRRLVMEEGYRYRDFAVMTRSLECYQGILDNLLEKYDIPYFMDRLQNISAKPLINLTLTAFEVLQSGWNSDDIFRYLKTGLAGLDTEEISMLENYILLWEISGKRWKEPFTGHPDGFSPDFSENDRKELERLNALRQRVVMPLLRFSKRVERGTGEELARAVYQLLEEISVAESLKKLAASLEQTGDYELADEQLRLWDLLMEILDQTALVLKEHTLSSKRYAELLRLVIGSSEIAFIPQGLDEVTVGAADRTRPAQPKVVFLIGAVEGEFPRSPVAAGVFSDAERRYLISLGLPMYDSLEQLAVEERFLAYTALASPSQKLYVCWCNEEISGEARAPSSIVREIRRIFPSLIAADAYTMDQRELVWAHQPAFELTAQQWSADSRFSQTLKRYFSHQEEYISRMQALSRAADARPAVFEDPKKAQRLFGSSLKLSASQVEKYYLCRFQYFCRYGLRARERKPAAFDALEYGSVMHYLLENMLKQHGQALSELESAQLKQEIQVLLEQYVETQLGGWSDKTPRFRYLFERLSATAEILLAHIAKELSQSAFQPEDYELKIAAEGDVQPLTLSLPDGGLVTVEGKVDRVDVMHTHGASYVRVIDYKTGVKDFKLSDVLYGLNMQMLLYLAAVWKNGESRYGKVLPAGVLYMPANKPMIQANRDAEADNIQRETEKKLRMNGLILDDPEIISGMEAEAKGVFIPVALKNGKPAKLDCVASLSEMGCLVKHIEQLVIDMAGTLRKGDVAAVPVNGERYNACEWCPYRSVCGHEEGGKVVTLEKWDRKQVMQALQEDKGGENAHGKKLDAGTKADD